MLLLIIFGILWMTSGRAHWFYDPRIQDYAIMGVTGFVVGVSVELWALDAGRWAYNAWMPLVPVLGVGLAPVTQMLVLPLIIFYLVRSRCAEPKRGRSQPRARGPS